MDIIDYEELYIIHPDGRVENKKTGKILKPRLNKDGYFYVNLSKNGFGTIFRIHKLIARHYTPNPDNLPVVDHIDFDRTNNEITNLRWVSYRESSLHRTCALATPNIYITPSGTCQVRINPNGFHFDKTFKTLAEAEHARDSFILEHGIK